MQPIAGLITANNRTDATLAQKSADLDLSITLFNGHLFSTHSYHLVLQVTRMWLPKVKLPISTRPTPQDLLPTLLLEKGQRIKSPNGNLGDETVLL